MTARQLAAKMHIAANRLAPTVSNALAAVGPEIVEAARERSSGNVLTRILSRAVARGGLGHPYGFGAIGSKGPRGPVPYGDPSIINVQRGVFRSSWKGNVSGFRLNVENDASFARYLLTGGRYSVPRPYDEPIKSFGAPLIANSVRSAVLDLYR